MRVRFYNLQREILPNRDEFINEFKNCIDQAEFVLGSRVRDFESKFADFCSVKYCVGVGSGLDAIVFALKAIGVQSGDEILVPALTFPATWIAVMRCGAIPVAVDVTLDSYTIDPSDLVSKISDRSTAVIPVHLYGHPADMKEILSIAKRHKLTVIEDCAQAHGAEVCGRPVGSIGKFGAFSFYPTKILGAFGDGGALTTDDLALNEKIRMLRNYGSQKKYEHLILGENSRLDELQAGFLGIVLDSLGRKIRLRQNGADTYLQLLRDTEPFYKLPKVTVGTSHSWHLFIIRCDFRDELKDFLYSQGVETVIHYPTTVYEQPFAGAFMTPNAIRAHQVSRTCLSLPMYPSITNSEISYVCDCLHQFMRAKEGK